MKKTYIAATIALMMGVLLVSSLAIAAAPGGEPQKKEIGIASTPTCIPGEIFEGDYLRIGINKGGTLGVTNGINTSTCIGDPGVGFQSVNDTPFSSTMNSSESAAIWFWGEGYKIAYKEFERGKGFVDTVAWWQPANGFPPTPATNIVPVSEKLLFNDHQKAIKEIKVITKDKKLLITFEFTFLKKYPELNLKTTITNLKFTPLRDVVYTRFWDIDVCTKTGSNNWTSTDHAAYAWDDCSNALKPWFQGDTFGSTVQLTFAGHDGDGNPAPVVNYVDLDAWDDYFGIRSPMTVAQHFYPVVADDHAGLYYKIGVLKPMQSKTVYTVYQSNFPKIKSDPTVGGLTATESPVDEPEEDAAN